MDGARGNYGCWGLCDFVGGTSVGGDVVENARRDEAEEKDVAQKVKGRRKGPGKKRK